MNAAWVYLLGAIGPSIVMALGARLTGRNLDLFFPNGTNGTSGCPPSRPESCECERFWGKDSGKYFQCATDPFCEHCAEHWYF